MKNHTPEFAIHLWMHSSDKILFSAIEQKITAKTGICLQNVSACPSFPWEGSIISLLQPQNLLQLPNNNVPLLGQQLQSRYPELSIVET